MPHNTRIRLITHPDTGETNSISGWAKKLGKSKEAIRQRLNRYPHDLHKVLYPGYLNDPTPEQIAQKEQERQEQEVIEAQRKAQWAERIRYLNSPEYAAEFCKVKLKPKQK